MNSARRARPAQLYRQPRQAQMQPPGAQIRIKPAAPRFTRSNLALDVPIAVRLTLGFLLAAVIASFAAGIAGIQRAQTLTNESTFYQSLLLSNTSLSTGDSFLQLMDTELHLKNLLDASAPNPSTESLKNDQTAIDGLEQRYDSILTNYTKTDLLSTHPDRVALLTEAGHAKQVGQQTTLASSVIRTWQVYRAAQDQVLQDIANGDANGAATLERAQGEPTHADAVSALRALTQFDRRLANSVRDAGAVEQRNQLLTTIIAAVLAFVGVGLVGIFISDTLVRRLRQLRRVTQDVEAGQLESRVDVIGRDEIGSVSASVNGMLDAIVTLLEETRRQRDALANAAERLFSDMRVASAGDLRVSAAVSNDPIGMLANAFNFTIGRFRRFIVRAQAANDQFDVLARQQIERADNYLMSVQQLMRSSSMPSMPSTPSSPASLPGGMPGITPNSGGFASDVPMRSGFSRPDGAVSGMFGGDSGALPDQITSAREQLMRVAREGANYHARAVLDLAEQAHLAASRIAQLTTGAAAAGSTREQQVYEVQNLDSLLVRLGKEAYAIQQNTTKGLAELDAALEQIGVSARAQGDAGIRGLGRNSLPGGAMAPAQAYQFSRMAASFAQDVATLARQLMLVTQEMRAGVTPFQLDPNAEENDAFYMPGMGVGPGQGGQGYPGGGGGQGYPNPNGAFRRSEPSNYGM